MILKQARDGKKVEVTQSLTKKDFPIGYDGRMDFIRIDRDTRVRVESITYVAGDNSLEILASLPADMYDAAAQKARTKHSIPWLGWEVSE
jgi:hypothetical protein